MSMAPNPSRDPRAGRLENNPFDRINQPRIEQPRQVNAPDLNHVLQSLWGMTQTQPVSHHKGKLWHFSEEEKKHLLLATGAFTLALGFVMANGISGLLAVGLIPWLVTVLIMMPLMLIAIGPAFVLHEIGHKLVAKHYGCWAEFRADPQGLKFGVVLAFILGFLFMAPGAVMVAGRVQRRQNGHIAAAGPIVNFGLFLIGIPLGAILLALVGTTEASMISSEGISLPAMVYFGITYWLAANLLLGLFNMLPFGPLDGLKVKDWSESAFWILIAAFAVPGVLWLGQIIDIMAWVEGLANLV